MNVLVCIKQVPAKSVPMDSESGVLDRTKVGGRLNPWDLYAVEAGLRIAEQTGGSVTALSMGPRTADSSVTEVLSMGVKDGALLCDSAFAGADVYATAFTLAQGIKALGKFDLIVCGQQTTDGDTAQLPFSLAAQLALPAVGWVKSIDKIEKNHLVISQELSFGTQKVTVNTPCLISVGAGIGRVRMPSLREKLRAKSKEIRVLTLSDLQDTNAEHYGLKASPTRVVRIAEAEKKAKVPPKNVSPKEAAKEILQALNKAKGGDIL